MGSDHLLALGDLPHQRCGLATSLKQQELLSLRSYWSLQSLARCREERPEATRAGHGVPVVGQSLPGGWHGWMLADLGGGQRVRWGGTEGHWSSDVV